MCSCSLSNDVLSELGLTEEDTSSRSVSASFDYGNGENIYSFTADSYTYYTISWTNDSEGRVAVSVSTSSSFYSSSTSDATSSPVSYYSRNAGTVYIKVAPYRGYDYNAGSFTLSVTDDNSSAVALETYSTNKGSKSSSSLNSATVSGSFNYGNGENIYRFWADSWTSYAISWTNGSGSRVAVSVSTSSSFYSSETAFSNQTSSPISYTNSYYYNQYVYIKVVPYNGYDYNAGSFTLTVSTTDRSAEKISLNSYSTNSGSSSSTTSYPYTSGASILSTYWTSGTISSSSGYIIYKFYVSTSGTYYIYLDDSSGSSYSYIDAKMYVKAGSSSFYSTDTYTDSGYSKLASVYASAGQYVYIKVMGYSSYSTGNFRVCAVNSSGAKQTLSKSSSSGAN